MPVGRTIRNLARQLRERARSGPKEVEEYLANNPSEWKEIARSDPSDAADIVEEVKESSAVNLIRGLDDDDAAEVLDETHPEVAAELISDLTPKDAAGVLELMNSDKAADVLGQLSGDVRARILAELPPRFASEVSSLLEYASDSAGGTMVTRVATCAPDETVSSIIESVRARREQLEDQATVFVVDGGSRLVGTVPLRELVFARGDATIAEVMQKDGVSVTADDDRARAAELAVRYNLDSVPVLDGDGRLLGALTRSAVLETVQQEASEDLAIATGTGSEESVFSRLTRSVRMRLPWLVTNVGMALAVVFVVERQKGIIDSNAVLAALMPLVAQVGGNGGAQSLAVILRGIATDTVSSHRVRSILVRQLLIGLCNGVAIGAIAAVIGTLIGGLLIGVALALGVLVNLTLGSLAGGAIPIILKKLGLDPALASNIFLTLVTDLVGFGGFLIIATVLL